MGPVVLLVPAALLLGEPTVEFSTRPCLAFLHQPRSAGLPIALSGLLRTWSSHHHCWQNTYSFRKACTKWKHYADADYYWGDMAMGLDGPAGPTRRRRCRWFTMWREPVERLISALRFCRAKADKAWVPHCGLNSNEGGFKLRPVNAKTASARDWAEHVGSYAFRQFLFAPDAFARVGATCAPGGNASAPQLPQVHRASGAARGASFECRTVHSWTEQRDALGACGDGISCDAGRRELRELVDAIANGTRFATVGLLSRWDESMRLFDRHVPLVPRAASRRARSWRDALPPPRPRPEGERAAEAAEVEAARRDPLVRARLAADLELYAAAERLFEGQMLEL
ncbi:hypothetical protein KFE25_004325 [Diacronema lutheri]|uniref:Sulfotransferase n=1 Tax=Diacronema lutheri TaxID=2081491 RepID=A0A8J5XD54_DIALT|nr:hypothetical protein KFE25_004325 [Diacronema lutheri]